MTIQPRFGGRDKRCKGIVVGLTREGKRSRKKIQTRLKTDDERGGVQVISCRSSSNTR